MKTLIEPQITVDGDKITIVAKIVDQPFNGLLVTRVSHGHLNPDHPNHPRRIQSSNEAVFVESHRAKFSMPNDFVIAIATAVEPATSFAPLFKKHSVPGNVEVVSESPVSYQWQVSDNAFPTGTFPLPPAIWNDISGATNATLDESTIKPGQWIRCVTKNATGTTTSQPAQKAPESAVK